MDKKNCFIFITAKEANTYIDKRKFQLKYLNGFVLPYFSIMQEKITDAVLNCNNKVTVRFCEDSNLEAISDASLALFEIGFNSEVLQTENNTESRYEVNINW